MIRVFYSAYVYGSNYDSKHSSVTAVSQSKEQVAANDSPIWKRKDVDGGSDALKETMVRCVGCGWRGQSAPQLNDEPVVMTTLAAIGNFRFMLHMHLANRSFWTGRKGIIFGWEGVGVGKAQIWARCLRYCCLLYTSPSPRD